LYAVINGFRPYIQSQVTQRRQETLDQALDQARLAEITMPTEDNTSSQLTAMRDEIKQLSTQVGRMSISTLQPAARRFTDVHSRSPTPVRSDRRVSFASPIRYPSCRSSTNGPFNDRYQPPSTIRYGSRRITINRQRTTDAPSQQRQQPVTCTRCGYSPQFGDQNCPAMGKFCYHCQRPNHLARCCIGARGQGSDTQQQNYAMRNRGYQNPQGFGAQYPPPPQF